MESEYWGLVGVGSPRLLVLDPIFSYDVGKANMGLTTTS